MRFATGSRELDKLLEGGYPKGITTVYGPSASGKTLFCLLAAVDMAKTKKVVYIDTAKRFSTKRINQISDDEKLFERIFLLKPKSFYEQKVMIENLKKSINKEVGLIIIDPISCFYRLEIAKKESNLINRVLISQLKHLNDIAEEHNIPILVTNDVYDDMEKKDDVKMLGGEILKKISVCIIELKNYETMKKAIIKKPIGIKDNSMLYKIEEKGISKVIHPQNPQA